MANTKERVVARLNSLGYADVTEDDLVLIELLIDKAESHIKNQTNLSSVPEGLEPYEIDYICGDFLGTKKALGQLTNYDVERGVSSVTMGDTSYTFDGNSDEVRMDNLFEDLKTKLEDELLCYRQIKW